MFPLDGADGQQAPTSRFDGEGRFGSLETMLFESLVHHLIEKGLLTKNDALSVVQTVAEVKRGQLPEEAVANCETTAELALLERIYGSFEAVRELSEAVGDERDNVRQLRPPLHGGQPKFPHDG